MSNNFSEKKKYAFVLPRYIAKLQGGAETLAGELAKRLRSRGATVEILTTCAIDHRTWENQLSEGVTVQDGVIVRRFQVSPRDLETWIPLQIRISQGQLLSIKDQLDWFTHGVNSLGLYEYIHKSGKNFDLIFFAPYLFGTTFWGSLIHPDRSILIPCLHDEEYAYLDVMQLLFSSVRGCLFNTEAEQTLCNRLFGTVLGGEVGMGFDNEEDYSGSSYFAEDFPYLLYFGRKELMKGVGTLIDNFVSFKDNFSNLSNLKLVIAGPGSISDLNRPKALERGDIIDLPPVSETEKKQLMANSLALCQPSTMESFSIVIMESWLQGTPVIDSERCAVTKQHVLKSGGGLYFKDQKDFNAILLALHHDLNLAKDLGRSGKNYVQNYYNWGVVLERFESVIAEINRQPKKLPPISRELNLSR